MANFFDQFDEAPAKGGNAAPSGNFFDQFDEPPKNMDSASFDAAFNVPMAGDSQSGTVQRGRQDLGQRMRLEQRARSLTGGNTTTGATVRGVLDGIPQQWGDEVGAGINTAEQFVRGLASGEGLEGATDRAGRYWNNVRAAQQAIETNDMRERPIARIAGEVGGSLLSAPLMVEVGGPALTGAVYGGVTGAGAEYGAENRAVGGAIGTGAGAALGWASPYIASGAAKVTEAAGKVGNAIAAPFRGVANPEAEAARRVSSALQRDLVQGGQSIDDAAFRAAQSSGQPVVLGDMGGESTRNLARSAANTSDEARSALQEATGPRFEAQSSRIADFVRSLTGSDGDAAATREALKQQARAANRPAYAKAYAQGAGGIWDDELAGLANAPAVQSAINRATKTGANRAAADGFRPVRNPFVKDADGNITLATNQDGSVARPTLQFWDHVKRNLDDMEQSARRAGRNSEASDIGALRDQIVNKLDNLAPSYGEARAGAARFFGARDASEAGEKFVSSTMTNAEARRAMSKMSDAERKLFADGFASSLISRLEGLSDRRDVVNAIFGSPKARERVQIALGKDAAAKLEANLAVENAMTTFRRAVSGNSTTAQQLAAMGLAGGIGNSALAGDFSPTNFTIGAAMGAAARGGLLRIDQRVARRVGEMLASSDPKVAQKAIEMAARNRPILEAIKQADDIFAKALAPQGSPVAGAANENVARPALEFLTRSLSGSRAAAGSEGKAEEEKRRQ